ncbi:hypothetical protein ANANG_G00162580 [Anguilla anguilla]|uniref:Uncharacterized protein n=1 Tax=Anguilla anguilla TaxID=7936 RepID=A0A9D3MBJ5_ANGAN|nr:hypothetical protein ANANG_G00162580 [Anguilla anguilla]
MGIGEKNHAFTVASFSGDNVDDKEDVTKKVTSAVEKVTSDYHSGSSSDEESGNREACVTPPFPHFQPRYQAVPQIPYQPVHVWHPFPKKKTGPGKGHGPPPSLWLPPPRQAQPLLQTERLVSRPAPKRTGLLGQHPKPGPLLGTTKAKQ